MKTTVKERIKAFIEYKGMSIRAFERSCNLSNGYINSIEQTIMPNKLDTISLQYPELNTAWLLTGEGEMIKPMQSVGDISNSNVSGVNVNGTEIHINPDAYSTLLKIVESNQKTTEKFQEQIDRLIDIIEKKL